MPRYYFDYRGSLGELADGEGLEVPDRSTALREAGKALGEAAAEELPRHDGAFTLSIDIRDETGDIISSIVMMVGLLEGPGKVPR